LTDGYNGVKRLPIVKECYDAANRYVEFAGAWVAGKIGWFPGLRLLVKYGILQKEGESVRGGRRAYYTMPDRSGVEKALHELGYL